jgi:hypothetical protein
MRARIAWLLAGLTLAMTVADILVTSTYRPLLSEEAVAEHGFPFLSLAILGSALLGAFIISRYDRHVIGWLLSLIGLIGAFSLLLEAYSIWVVGNGGPGPRELAGVLGLASSLTGGQLAIGGLALLFLLAPDGHLLSPRWRYVAAAVPVGEVLCFLALMTADATSYDIEAADVGPVRQGLFTLGFTLISIGVVGGVVSMVVRLRRSRGEERQQMALISLAAALLAAAIATLFVVQTANGGRQTWASTVPLFVAYMLLPLLFGLAVLRYRLYDLAIFVNRALVLAIGTAFAAAGYTTLVVLVGNQVGSRAGGFGVSLLVTAVVALAFQPLRRWVVHLANRLAYGPRARPYIALSRFSRRLAETPTPETLLPAVAEAAGRAVSARGAAATLDVPGVGVVSADWGETGRDTALPYDVPVRAGEAVLGRITVLVPKGRTLRAADARLLQAVADQAAVAFRNTAMEAELAERVAALDRTTTQLAESRGRIIDADDAARRALETAISRDVLPQLRELPDRLGRARRAVVDGSGDHSLDELVRSANEALESLRELTRGVFPTQLPRAGLEPALRSGLARSGLAANLRVGGGAVDRRFSERVEAAVYFCCAEAVRAMSDRSSVELTTDGSDLVLRIGALAGGGMDLQAVEDRIAAADGSLTAEAGQLTVRFPGASVLVATADGGTPGR